MISTTAPVVEFTIAGKPRKLLMGFMACRRINLNPLKTAEIQAYLADLSCDKAIEFIIAGVENAAKILGDSESLPTAEEIAESLDFHQFLAIVKAAFEVKESSNETPNRGDPIPNP